MFPPVVTRTGSIRDDSYWTSRKNGLELIEISSIDKVSSVGPKDFIAFISHNESHQLRHLGKSVNRSCINEDV